MSIAGEVAQRVPSVQDAAFMWIDQFQKGRFQVKVDLTDLDRPVDRLNQMSRVIAVAVVVTGLMIGSALAADVTTAKSGFVTGLAHTALVLYTLSAAVAVVLLAALIRSLVRRPRRRRRRLDIG
jgi:hypothetical protein